MFFEKRIINTHFQVLTPFLLSLHILLPFLYTPGTLGILVPLATPEIQHVLCHTLGYQPQMSSLLVHLENPSSSIKKGPWRFSWPTHTWFGSSRTSCASLFIILYLLPDSCIFEVSYVIQIWYFSNLELVQFTFLFISFQWTLFHFFFLLLCHHKIFLEFKLHFPRC